jgi:addiction module HigA family antidote
MSKKLLPIHPGEILFEEFLKPLAMSMNKLAAALHVAPNRIAQICGGDRSITGDTALRLGRYFGTSPAFWLGMQMEYELAVAQDQVEEEIAHQVKPRAA